MTVTNIRMKFAAAATILGLGGLGGFAMGSNPARDSQPAAQTPIAATQVASSANSATTATVPVSYASRPVSTRTSGAAAGAHGHHRSMRRAESEVERD